MSLAFSSRTIVSRPDLKAGNATDAFLSALFRLTGIQPDAHQTANDNRRRAAQEIARLPLILQQDIAPGIDPTHENL